MFLVVQVQHHIWALLRSEPSCHLQAIMTESLLDGKKKKQMKIATWTTVWHQLELGGWRRLLLHFAWRMLLWCGFGLRIWTSSPTSMPLTRPFLVRTFFLQELTGQLMTALMFSEASLVALTRPLVGRCLSPFSPLGCGREKGFAMLNVCNESLTWPCAFLTNKRPALFISKTSHVEMWFKWPRIQYGGVKYIRVSRRLRRACVYINQNRVSISS